jgi:predicted amidohydrolase
VTARPNAYPVTVFLRVYPSRQQYRLPREEDPGELTTALAEILGKRGCVVLGYDVPDQPRCNAVVLINGNVVDTVELVDVPDEASDT